MASHLSSLGFPVENREEFVELALRAAREGELIPFVGGAYARWDVGGVELWAQLIEGGRVVGMNPHYSGAARMRAAITSKIAREDRLFDGAFHGWASPRSEDPESGDYPFVFDAPDYRLHDDLGLPLTVEVQLAAFAHELTAYANDDEYYAAQRQKYGSPGFAAESFIPSGLFQPGGEDIDPPRAHAIFSGHVLEAALRTNPGTGASFQWARVRTYGAEVDLVADPELLDAPLTEGSVVSGTFWLSGRIVR